MDFLSHILIFLKTRDCPFSAWNEPHALITYSDLQCNSYRCRVSSFWLPGWARREQTDEVWQSPRSPRSWPFSARKHQVCHLLLEAFRRCFHCPEAQCGTWEAFSVSFYTKRIKSDFHVGLWSLRSSEEHLQATMYTVWAFAEFIMWNHLKSIIWISHNFIKIVNFHYEPPWAAINVSWHRASPFGKNGRHIEQFFILATISTGRSIASHRISIFSHLSGRPVETGSHRLPASTLQWPVEANAGVHMTILQFHCEIVVFSERLGGYGKLA